MGIFTLSDGTRLEPIDSFDTTYEPVIPDGTQLQCQCIKAEWDINNSSILVTLNVIQKGEFKNLKVLHTLKLHDANTIKANKAKGLLMAYDQNGKGLIDKHDRAGRDITDKIISDSLVKCYVVAHFKNYEKSNMTTGEPILDDDGNPIKGHYVCAITPMKKKLENQDMPLEDKPKRPVKQKDDDFDDLDIPF